MGITKDRETPAQVAALIDHHYREMPEFLLELVRLLLKQLQRNAVKHGFEATTRALDVGIALTADVLIAVEAMGQNMRTRVAGDEHTNINLDSVAAERSMQLEKLKADLDAEGRR